MELFCPECMTPLVRLDGETATCPAHSARFRILFCRDPQALPAAIAAAPVAAAMAPIAPFTPAVERVAVSSEQATMIAHDAAAPVAPPASPAAPPETIPVAPPPLPVQRPALAPLPAPHIPHNCQTHPQMPAVALCHMCGAPVCATCDFAFPTGTHLCPGCAVNPRVTTSPGRRKLAYWSLGLGIWAILGMVLLFSGIAFTEHQSDREADAVGSALAIFFMLPTLVGLALGLASFERRMENSVVSWIGTILNGLVMLAWLLMIIVGTTMG